MFDWNYDLGNLICKYLDVCLIYIKSDNEKKLRVFFWVIEFDWYEIVIKVFFLLKISKDILL